MLTRQVDTRLMLFIATALITLSHLDAFVPDRRIASGGAIGNSLFFFLSGFGISSSFIAAKHAGRTNIFSDYFQKRLARIFPAVLVVIAPALWVMSQYSSESLDFFQTFVWPTPFWFIPTIISFYVPLYFIAKFKAKYIALIMAILVLPYAFFYIQLDLSKFTTEDHHLAKIINYFCIVLMGCFAAQSNITPKLSIKTVFFLIASLLLFLFAKLFLFKYNAGHLQFVFHLLLYPIVFYCFHVFASAALLKLLASSPLQSLVTLLSGLTLEIYLTQGPWLAWLEHQDLGVNPYVLLAMALVPIPLFSIVAQQLAKRLSVPFSNVRKRQSN